MKAQLAVILFFVSSSNLAMCKELPKLEWWKTSIFYHLYPRSFSDYDGDGVGDLKGIIHKGPDHFKDLGIEAVWLSPIFKSPMADFGYDISDYYSFEDVFGDLNDFEELKEKLHANKIKLLLDFVPNHTSDKHEWFQKSLEGIPPYDEFYIWRDPKGFNGSDPILPNNWRSEFGGPAWTYVAEKKKFYLHHFLPEQPDLNYDSPQLVTAMTDVLRFWLDKGVDGFRLDAVNFLFEDPEFRDDLYVNPNVTDDPSTYNINPIFSKNQPKMFDMVREWREVLDKYSKEGGEERVMLIEAYTSINNSMQFYKQGEAIMAFNFFLLTELNASSSAQDVANTINMWLDNMPEGKWPNWLLGNHDNPRTSSRFSKELTDGLNMLNLLLPGTPIVYYGEEIGMVDADITWEETVDPFGIRVGEKLFKKYSRDPERTPFQWDDSTSAGFSKNGDTWLPVNPNYYDLNLESQKAAPNSHYKVFKRLSQIRTKNVFRYGQLNIYVFSKEVFVFTRTMDGEDPYIVVINFGNFQETVTLSEKIQLPQTVTVHTASLNSKYKIGDEVSTLNSGLSMRPKSALVLTTAKSMKMETASYSSSRGNDEL